MVRYCKQRDKYSCGPIMIINALKWGGYNASYEKDFNRVTRQTLCGKRGSYTIKLLPLLRSKFKVAQDDFPTLSSIGLALREGKAIAVCGSYRCQRSGNLGSHYFLIVGRSRTGKYKVANVGRAVGFMRRKMLSDILKQRRCIKSKAGYPSVWYIAPIV